MELIDTAGRTIRAVRPPQQDAEIRSLLSRYNPMVHPAVMMRKGVALATGGYRKALLDADDYDLWLRMGERSRFANLADSILKYRVHRHQVSIRGLERQTHCALAARAAAVLRSRGLPDPLSGVDEVTPELLNTLGVTADEIREALLGAYAYWVDVLGVADPETALQMVERLRQLSGADSSHRSVLADAALKAAGIHLRQGRPGKALASAGRAVLIRPVLAGRPVKKALSRLAEAFESRR